MFCYQCEQTSKGEGCQTIGVCGKDETTAALQDLLLLAVKGIGMYAHRARQLGAADPVIDTFTIQSIFATLTNVNFDPERLVGLIHSRSRCARQARRPLREGRGQGRRSRQQSSAVPPHGARAPTSTACSPRAIRSVLPVRASSPTARRSPTCRNWCSMASRVWPPTPPTRWRFGAGDPPLRQDPRDPRLPHPPRAHRGANCSARPSPLAS